MKKIGIFFMAIAIIIALTGCAQTRNQAPVIQGVVTEETIEIGSEYNPLDGVIATDDNDGNITDQIQVVGTYDVNSVGEYTFTLKVEDSAGLTDEVTVVLNVEDSSSDNLKPTLVGVKGSQTYYIGYGAFDPIEGVSATDPEDGIITDNIVLEGDYNLEEVGTYILTVKVTDSANASASKTIVLNVKRSSVPDTLTTDSIEIVFWHAFGDEKGGYLQEYADQFELLYPNVTITLASQGGYDDLLSKTTSSIVAGNEPTMLIAYPDHVSSYLSANAVESLDLYVNHTTHGVDLDDFIPSYIDENKAFDSEGTLYGLPFNKSTEVMIYNKTYFDAKGYTAPTTWAEVETIAASIKAEETADDVYGFAYDSAANMFITLTRQWGGEYTSVDEDGNGVYLFDNPETRAMMSYFKGLEEDNYVTLPSAWDQDYASEPFKNQQVFMTIGSTAGISYNVPSDGAFEIGVAPIPQYDANNKHVIQQGTNITIMKSATDQEKLAAWLFTKYLTSKEVTTDWAIKTGYLPVRESAYDSTDYQNFLNSPIDKNKYTSMAANAAYLQREYMFVDQPFIGSSKVRAEVDLLLNTVLVGEKTIDEAIQTALDEIE